MTLQWLSYCCWAFIFDAFTECVTVVQRSRCYCIETFTCARTHIMIEYLISVHTSGLLWKRTVWTFCSEGLGQDLDQHSLTWAATKCQTDSSTAEVCSTAKYHWNTSRTTAPSLCSLLLYNWNGSELIFLYFKLFCSSKRHLFSKPALWCLNGVGDFDSCHSASKHLGLGEKSWLRLTTWLTLH